MLRKLTFHGQQKMGRWRMEDRGWALGSPGTFGSADLPGALLLGPAARVGLELALFAVAEGMEVYNCLQLHPSTSTNTRL